MKWPPEQINFFLNKGVDAKNHCQEPGEFVTMAVLSNLTLNTFSDIMGLSSSALNLKIAR